VVDRPGVSRPGLKVYAGGTNLVNWVASASDTTTLSFVLGTLSAGIYYGEIYEKIASGSIPFVVTLN